MKYLGYALAVLLSLYFGYMASEHFGPESELTEINRKYDSLQTENKRLDTELHVSYDKIDSMETAMVMRDKKITDLKKDRHEKITPIKDFNSSELIQLFSRIDTGQSNFR